MIEEYWYQFRGCMWGPFGTPKERQAAIDRRMHKDCLNIVKRSVIIYESEPRSPHESDNSIQGGEL